MSKRLSSAAIRAPRRTRRPLAGRPGRRPRRRRRALRVARRRPRRVAALRVGPGGRPARRDRPERRRARRRRRGRDRLDGRASRAFAASTAWTRCSPLPSDDGRGDGGRGGDQRSPRPRRPTRRWSTTWRTGCGRSTRRDVRVGGEQLLDDEVAELAERDAQRAEALSLPVALVVMAVVFGGRARRRAAARRRALAASRLTTLVLAGLAALTDVSLYAINVTIMLGLGLGIDYGLLVVSRFREERGAGHDVADVGPADDGHRRPHDRVLGADGGGRARRRCSCSTTRRSARWPSAGIGVVLAAAAVGADAAAGPAAAVRAPPPAGGARRCPRRVRPAGPGDPAPGVAGRAGGRCRARARSACPFAGARFDDTGVKALPTSSETAAGRRGHRRALPRRSPPSRSRSSRTSTPTTRRWPAGWPTSSACPACGGVQVERPLPRRDDRRRGRARGRDQRARPRRRVVRSLRALDASASRWRWAATRPRSSTSAQSISDRLPLAIGAASCVATFVLLFLMTGSVVVPAQGDRDERPVARRDVRRAGVGVPGRSPVRACSASTRRARSTS